MEADHYDSLLRSRAEAIELSRVRQRTAGALRGPSRNIVAATLIVAVDSTRVIDLILDHVLCDPRLSAKSYGRQILKSLPPMRLTRDLAAVQAFFAPRPRDGCG